MQCLQLEHLAPLFLDSEISDGKNSSHKCSPWVTVWKSCEKCDDPSQQAMKKNRIIIKENGLFYLKVKKTKKHYNFGRTLVNKKAVLITQMTSDKRLTDLLKKYKRAQIYFD